MVDTKNAHCPCQLQYNIEWNSRKDKRLRGEDAKKAKTVVNGLADRNM